MHLLIELNKLPLKKKKTFSDYFIFAYLNHSMSEYSFTLTTVAAFQYISQNENYSKTIKGDPLFGPKYEFWLSLSQEQKESMLSVLSGPLTNKYKHVKDNSKKNGNSADLQKLKSEMKQVEEQYEITVLIKKKD